MTRHTAAEQVEEGFGGGSSDSNQPGDTHVGVELHVACLCALTDDVRIARSTHCFGSAGHPRSDRFVLSLLSLVSPCATTGLSRILTSSN